MVLTADTFTEEYSLLVAQHSKLASCGDPEK